MDGGCDAAEWAVLGVSWDYAWVRHYRYWMVGVQYFPDAKQGNLCFGVYSLHVEHRPICLLAKRGGRTR